MSEKENRRHLYLLMWSVPDATHGLYYEWLSLDVAGWAEVSAEMHRMEQRGEVADFILHHIDTSTHPPVTARSGLHTVRESLDGSVRQKQYNGPFKKTRRRPEPPDIADDPPPASLPAPEEPPEPETPLETLPGGGDEDGFF